MAVLKGQVGGAGEVEQGRMGNPGLSQGGQRLHV